MFQLAEHPKTARSGQGIMLDAVKNYEQGITSSEKLRAACIGLELIKFSEQLKSVGLYG